MTEKLRSAKDQHVTLPACVRTHVHPCQPSTSRRAFLRRAALGLGALAGGRLLAACAPPGGPAAAPTAGPSASPTAPPTAAPTPGPTPEPTARPAAAVHLDEYFTRRLESREVVGLAACLVRAGGVVWSNGYGWANREERQPMTPDTLLNIASTSKTITAVALMQLWEQGRFDLDEDVNAYLPFAVHNPHYPAVPITFQHLLTHQSSLADGPAYLASYACGDPALALGDWLQSYLVPAGASYDADANFHPFEPGARFEYSNIGFGLAGYLVETIAGTPFHRYCRDNVFAPLGMAQTAYHLRDLDLAQHALPYAAGVVDLPGSLQPEEAPAGAAEGLFPLCRYGFPNLPDGLVRTSVRQLARFLSCVLQGGSLDGTRLLQADTVARLLSEELRNPFGAGTRQGLGWMALPYRGERVWGHAGGDPGVSTQMWFSPALQAGAILFANSNVRLEPAVERLLAAAEDFS